MKRPGDELRRKAREISTFLRGDALEILKIEGEKHFKKAFRDEGFTDEVLEKWTPSKRIATGQGDYADRGTLTQSGALGRSIKGHSDDLNKVIFETPFDWAEVHNEGLRAGRGAGFIMPKRKFMGRSRVLERAITKQIEEHLLKIWKS